MQSGRFLPFSVALAGALIVPSIAAAVVPYSAVRAGIDNACNAPATSAVAQTVYLARLDGPANAPGVWQVASADTEEKSVVADRFAGGEFATVRARDTVLSAFVVRREPNGDVGRTRNWCFIGGGITRAGSEIVDTTTQIDWHRTQYFDPSLDSSENDIVGSATMTQEAGRKKQPPAPLDRLTIDAYKSPAELPFYDAYRAARSHASKGRT